MRRVIFAPFVLLPLVWMVVLGGFYLGPFSISPLPRFNTLLFLFICITIFVTASLVSYYWTREFDRYEEAIPSRREKWATRLPVNVVLTYLSFTSLAGLLFIVFERTVSTDLVGLAGFTELRYLRAEELATGTERERGWLTYFGWLLYPGLYLVCVVGFLCYDELSRRTKLLLLLNMLGPFVLAVLYGGRSPILALFLLLLSACVVRIAVGKSALPRSAMFKLLGVTALVVFVVYTNLIWFERLELTSQTVEMFLSHVATIWGIEPGASLVDLLVGLDQLDFLVPLLGLYFYLFQGPATLEKILSTESIPILFGGQHIDIVAAAFLIFSPTREMLARGYDALLDANIYGFFTTAWGSLFIDISYLTFIFAAIWGWVSGLMYWRLKRRRQLGDAALYAFLMYTVLISPISAPFGLANSFSIFLYVLGFWLWARVRAEKYRSVTSIGVRLRPQS